MATITEEYVSFEVAKLLKEKGFKENCLMRYSKVGDLVEETYKFNWNFQTIDYSAPTLQIAMKWLREVHGLFVFIGSDDLDYNWQIFDVRNRTKDLDPICLTDSYGGYRKYELACEAACIYALKNLI